MIARRLLLSAVGVPAFLAAGLLGVVALLALLSVPPEDAVYRVRGLDGPLTVVWDANGVPTIRAESERDAYFGLGFVHARDRFWQMELRRRAAAGRLAEILGPSALPMDRLVRTLGLARRAGASLTRFAAADRRLLEAYARGVEAWHEVAPLRPLPMVLLDVPLERWRPEDSLAIQKLLALDLERDWRSEMSRTRLLARLGAEAFADLYPEVEAGEIATVATDGRAALDRRARRFAALEAVLPPAPAGGASNAWAVAPVLSAEGGPILANDPHLRLEWPIVWYLARLEAPGFEATGGTIPGLPAVIVGHGRHLAWGFTTTGADTQDLFEVRALVDDPRRYRTAAGSARFVLREERIAVRGRPPETLTVRETRWGPVISDLVGGRSADPAYALAWPALAEDDTTVAFAFRLPRARGAADLRRAAPLFVAPVHNLVWAASDGSIGFRVLGRVPLRRGRDGLLPVAADAPEAEWRGFLAVDRLPSLVDPADGRIVNANNRPADGELGALLGRDWPAPLRAERIQELLERTGRAGLAAHAAIQLDIRSGLARSFLPLLAAVRFEEARLEGLRRRLVAWDGRMARDGFEPALFAAWYRELLRAVAEDELGPLFEDWRGTRWRFLRRVFGGRGEWCDDVRTARPEHCEDRVVLAFRRAVDWLGRRWRRPVEELRWGDLHLARMEGPVFGTVPGLAPLFRASTPLGGGRSTVDVAAWYPSEPFEVRHAPGLRMLVVLSTPIRSRWMIATGQSGRPLSPHARDLVAPWAAGAYLRIGSCGAGDRGCERTRLLPAVGPGSG